MKSAIPLQFTDINHPNFEYLKITWSLPDIPPCHKYQFIVDIKKISSEKHFPRVRIFLSLFQTYNLSPYIHSHPQNIYPAYTYTHTYADLSLNRVRLVFEDRFYGLEYIYIYIHIYIYIYIYGKTVSKNVCIKMYKYENWSLEDDFIYSLNYMPMLNVSVFECIDIELSSSRLNCEMKREIEKVLNILFP